MNLPMGNVFYVPYLYKSSYKIEKIIDSDQYYIYGTGDGYSRMYSSYIGTPRELAKSILLSYTKMEDRNYWYDGYVVPERQNSDVKYIDQFIVTFKPTARVVFQDGAQPAPDVDLELLATEITKALNSLRVFIPFS